MTLVHKKGLQWLIACMIPAMLTGCQLLPVEEQLPVIRPLYVYEAEKYQQATVQRGDLEDVLQVNCTYEAVHEEIAAFTLGDLYVEQVLVKKGQKVQAGDLLASLEQADIQQQVTDLAYRLEVLQLKLTYLLQSKMLALEECELRWDWQQVQEKRAEVEEKYAAQLQDIEDEIYIQSLRLEEKKAEIKQRQLVAGINGTVTYIKEMKAGMQSVKGEGFARIVDFDTAVFYVRGENADYFPVGTKTSIRNNVDGSVTYEVISVDPSALGITPIDEKCAYLKLIQPDPQLEDGTSGTIVITLEKKKDVLYVDRSAVKTTDGEPFVYVMNEDGLREIRMVKTGLRTDKYVEIVAGLQEGDKVILK